MGRSRSFIINYSIKLLVIIRLAISPLSSEFSLKLEKEPLIYKRCKDDVYMDIWHTPNKQKALYLLDEDIAFHTPEGRILQHPQNAEEVGLRDYFLAKEFPLVELFLDDEKFAKNYRYTLMPFKWKRVLRHVVRWMSEYKFLETDPRVFSKLAELPEDRYLQRALYRQFPVPVLTDFHPIVQEACEKGLLYCLKQVHEYAIAHAQQFNKYLNSDHNFFLKQYHQLRKAGNRHSVDLTQSALKSAKNDFCALQGDLGFTWYSGQNYEPFLSRNDFFEFRTTASYYLCNYTIAQRRLYEHLAYPGSPDTYPAKWATPKFKVLECLFDYQPVPAVTFDIYHRTSLVYTMATLDGFPCDAVGSCQTPIRGKMGQKRHDDQAFWDFSCVMMAFCPDVCCGTYKNPLEQPHDIDRCTKKDKDYPCRDGAQNDNCDYDVQKNGNFFDLIQNRINMTCGCNANEGKEWDSSLGICLDVDECVSTNPCNRHSEVCINRLNGSRPLCVCEFGYYRRNGGGPCIVDPNSGLFQNIDEAELRMKQLYSGPIVEGKVPNYTLIGKEAEVNVLKMALGGSAFKSKNIARCLTPSLHIVTGLLLFLSDLQYSLIATR